MNGNSSKQVLLSVLGIAVLVVAVVGVSFAFFTYSKNGEANNTIQTGSIFFQFTEGTAITLSNQFPIPDSQGATLTSSVEGDNPSLTFYIKGTNTSTKDINYTITATNGENMTGKTRLNDSGIKLYLDASGATTGTVTNNYSAVTGTPVGTDGSLASGRVLATGTIPGGTNTEATNTFVLHMWISAAAVSIDENETVGNNDNVYTSAEFKDLFYSLKVNVTAEATN